MEPCVHACVCSGSGKMYYSMSAHWVSIYLHWHSKRYIFITILCFLNVINNTFL